MLVLRQPLHLPTVQTRQRQLVLVVRQITGVSVAFDKVTGRVDHRSPVRRYVKRCNYVLPFRIRCVREHSQPHPVRPDRVHFGRVVTLAATPESGTRPGSCRKHYFVPCGTPLHSAAAAAISTERRPPTRWYIASMYFPRYLRRGRRLRSSCGLRRGRGLWSRCRPLGSDCRFLGGGWSLIARNRAHQYRERRYRQDAEPSPPTEATHLPYRSLTSIGTTRKSP